MSENKENRRVVFRRINGRIVPIVVGGTGAALALDAARSDVVRVTKSGYSVRKKFTLMPMSLSKGEIEVGTTITHRNNMGRKLGTVSFHKGVDGMGEINWLSVKKWARGKGISKHLVHDAAVEMRDAGMKKLSSHVVHERSASLLGNKSRSTFWKSYRTSKDGSSFVKQVGKKEAIASVAGGKWKEKGKSVAAVFRDTTLPRMRRVTKPFKSLGIKAQLVAGIGLIGLGAYLGYNKREEK